MVVFFRGQIYRRRKIRAEIFHGSLSNQVLSTESISIKGPKIRCWRKNMERKSISKLGQSGLKLLQCAPEIKDEKGIFPNFSFL